MVPRSVGNKNTLFPGLSIIHSNHLEDLRRVAVQWVRSNPLRPLENEVLLTQSNGMAQWLKLSIAADDGCGISASLDIQLPGHFLWSAYRAVLGDTQIPKQSPYDKERLIWRLFKLLPSLPENDQFSPLTRFLTEDEDLRKRYQLATHLASLYDQYQVYRADWLEDWGQGKNQVRNAKDLPGDFPEGQGWQAELWRRIQNDIDVNERETSRSALHRRFIEGVEKTSCRPEGLPRRIIVFGICSLPKQTLESLHALSRHCQVLLFVHNPCRHFWADIIEDRELLKIENARHLKKDKMPVDLDPALMHQHVNPLLAAWGKQGRDYIGMLYGYDQPDEYRERFAEIDMFTGSHENENGNSLLAHVQLAILNLHPIPDPAEKQPVDVSDHSICFHLAHSRQREVEILQDRLLSLFQNNADLNPRDIIVMTPDIDSYSAHIEAVFGNLQSQDDRYIPFTIADTPERSSVPMLLALEKLLHLPESRMAVSDLMDLLEVPAFRERFKLSKGDLPKLHQWIEGAGIRWGLSAEQRKGFDLPEGLDQNTWLFGLRRMLLGYAVGSGPSWQTIEPYDEIGGLEAALVGPLFDILETLENHSRILRQPASAGDWLKRIIALMSDCFSPANNRDRLTWSRMEETLEKWHNDCADAGLEEALSLPVVRTYILGELTDASMSRRFLAGMVNFCTMMPMRAIPFKVVCLLGMNDGEFPRSHPPLDFDIMAMPGYYRPGDRSRREDDRYLFLEALLSAREKLYISYIGRSIRDNSERMPSVLVAQLQDYLSAGWRLNGENIVPKGEAEDSDTSSLMRILTCRHPLQPFSKAYFHPEREKELFTYASEWRAVFEQTKPGGPDKELDAPQFEGSLQLNQLIRFMKNPVQAFFNQRLKVYFDDIDVTSEDLEPFELSTLAHFGLGAGLLDAGRAAQPDTAAHAVNKAAERLQQTGVLPLAAFGEMAAAELAEPVQVMLLQHYDLKKEWPHKAEAKEIALPVSLTGCGCDTLEDWLDGLRTTAPSDDTPPMACARWEFYPINILDKKGRVSRMHSLTALWVKHLAGCASGLLLTSYLVAPDGKAALAPVEKTTALKWLTVIINHWWEGQKKPLSVTAKTALAFLKEIGSGNPKDTPEIKENKAIQAARKVYEGDGFNSNGELGYSTYLARVYPGFEILWNQDDNLFRELSESLYGPMISHVQKPPESSFA